jgi:malonyl-CoA O-methyltransferase
LRRWHGCLAVDGILMFSTLGPGTLERLRRLYAEEAWGPPMAELVDMHDLGDMLVAAGFVDPVMDQETLRLTWGKAEEALIELRSLGSNAHPHRMAGLRTPRWRQRLLEGLKRVATRAGREGIELEFEVVYGHAVKAAPRLRVESESRIGLDEMRQSLRAARPRPSV